jgi:hypothetical protein
MKVGEIASPEMKMTSARDSIPDCAQNVDIPAAVQHKEIRNRRPAGVRQLREP